MKLPLPYPKNKGNRLFLGAKSTFELPSKSIHYILQKLYLMTGSKKFSVRLFWIFKENYYYAQNR